MADRNALKVGVISFLMLTVLAGLLIWKSGVFYRLDGYEIVGEFSSVNGLVNGAEVRYRGSRVGKVYRIDPTPRAVLVRFRVDSSVKIPKNSAVKIYFDGLIGEKFLNIVPNAQETEMLSDGDVMQGTVSAGLAEFVELGAKNLESTQKILETYEKILNSPEMTNAFQNTVLAVEKLSQDMAVLSGMLSGTDPRSNGSIPKILSNLATTTEIIKQNTDLMLGDGQIASSSRAAVSNLAASTDQLRSMVMVLNQQLVTSKNMAKLSATIDTVYSLSDSAKSVVAVGSGLNASGELMAFPISTGADQQSYHVNSELGVGRQFGRVGIAGTKAANSPWVNAQLGTQLTDGTRARAGYFYSQLGVGVDQRILPKTTVSVEVYNVEKPEVDIKGNYKFADKWGAVVNWKKDVKTQNQDQFGVGVSYGGFGE